MILIDSCRQLLTQLLEVTEQLSDPEFDQSALNSGHSIGMRIVSALEFFVCLNEGFAKGSVNPNFDDFRTNLKTRAQTITVTRSILKLLYEETADKTLVLEAGYSKDKASFFVETSYYDELASGLQHASHYMHVIKAELPAIRPGVVIADDFGVPATLGSIL